MFYPDEIREVFQIRKICTAFSQVCDSSYFFEGETHNFWEIVVVLDGEIGITSGSDVFLLKKGQAIIHAPMEFHRLWSEGGSCPKILIFSFEAVNVPNYSLKLFEIKDIAEAEGILKDIEASFTFNGGWVKKAKDGSLLKAQIALKRLEIFLLDMLSQRPVQKTAVKSCSAKNYNTIVMLLENNIDKNLTVCDVAKMCGMSEINLKKTFSRYAGIGVMQYFNRLKVAEAISLLKNGKSVKEIAAELGFSNQNYFSTVFKRITGYAPTYYGRNAKN